MAINCSLRLTTIVGLTQNECSNQKKSIDIVKVEGRISCHLPGMIESANSQAQGLEQPSQGLEQSPQGLEQPPEQQQGATNPYSPKRSQLWALLAVLVVTGGGIGLWRWLHINQGEAQAQITERALPPRPVETIPLEAGSGVQRVQLLGQVEAGESATIRSQTSGVVQQILVSEGDRINAGDLIASVDAIDQQLILSQARLSWLRPRVNWRNWSAAFDRK